MYYKLRQYFLVNHSVIHEIGKWKLPVILKTIVFWRDAHPLYVCLPCRLPEPLRDRFYAECHFWNSGLLSRCSLMNQEDNQTD